MSEQLLNVTINAIDVLNNQSTGDFNQANTFLVDLQNSNDAWSIAVQLLHKNKDRFTSYFGAQTMRNKVQLHFEELPVEYHSPFRQSLLEQMSNNDHIEDSTISNQLCIALADMYCHMVQWENGINDIIAFFIDKSIYILLDVLRYIPEEQNNKSLRLGSNRKEDLYSKMETCRHMVLSVFDRAMKLEDEPLWERAIKCLDSWFCAGLFRDADVADSLLVQLIFRVLQAPDRASDSLFSAASGTAAAMLGYLEPDSMPRLTITLVRLVTQTMDGVNCGFQLAVTSRPDRCIQYARLMCEAALCLLPRVLNAPQPDDDSSDPCRSVRLLRQLLKVAGTGVECCAEVVETLCSVLERDMPRHQRPADDPTSRALLCPLLEQLVAEMARFCVPSLHDDEDSLVSFRGSVFRAMEEVRCLLELESLYLRLMESLSALLTAPCASEGQQERAEALIFVIGSVVKFVDLGQQEQQASAWTRQLLESVVLVRLRDAQVSASFRDVAFTLFGELSGWLVEDAQQELLASVLEEAALFLERHETDSGQMGGAAVDSALLAVSCILRRQGRALLLSTEANRQRVVRVLMCLCCSDNSDSNNNSGVSGGRAPREMPHLLESLGRCLAPDSRSCAVRTESDAALVAGLARQICQLLLGRLQRVCSAQGTPATPKTLADPCVWLDALAAFYCGMPAMTGVEGALPNYLVAAHAAVFLEFVWPLAGTLLRSISEGRVLERVVRLVRYSVRSLQTAAEPALSDMATALVRAYVSSRESCMLYLGGVVVDEFSSPQHAPFLLQMFQALCPAAMEQLAGAGLDQRPDTAEDLFRLTVRIAEHCPPGLLQESDAAIDSVMGLAARAVACANPDTRELAVKLLLELRARLTHPNSQQWSELVLESLLRLCKWHHDHLRAPEADSFLEDVCQLLLHLSLHLPQFPDRLEAALHRLGLGRRDGLLLYVNSQQLASFRELFPGQDRPQLPLHAVCRGLKQFAALFS